MGATNFTSQARGFFAMAREASAPILDERCTAAAAAAAANEEERVLKSVSTYCQSTLTPGRQDKGAGLPNIKQNRILRTFFNLSRV